MVLILVHSIAEVFLRKISFPEKSYQKLFPGGCPQSGIVRKSHFGFNDVKSTEVFIFDIQIVEKCLVRGVLTIFFKVPFWVP